MLYNMNCTVTVEQFQGKEIINIDTHPHSKTFAIVIFLVARSFTRYPAKTVNFSGTESSS